MPTTLWNDWIHDNWVALATGMKLNFAQENLAAEEAGQCRDWILALSDKSRLQVREFADGRVVAHRDRWDPNRGVPNMVKHVAFETTLGGLALFGALGINRQKIPGAPLTGIRIGCRIALT